MHASLPVKELVKAYWHIYRTKDTVLPTPSKLQFKRADFYTQECCYDFQLWWSTYEATVHLALIKWLYRFENKSYLISNYLQSFTNELVIISVRFLPLLLLLLLLPPLLFLLLLLLLHLFTLPRCRTYSPGTYNPNARGSDACRRSNSLWTRTLDRYTRAGLPEYVVSTMSGPPPKTT